MQRNPSYGNLIKISCVVDLIRFLGWFLLAQFVFVWAFVFGLFDSVRMERMYEECEDGENVRGV